MRPQILMALALSWPCEAAHARSAPTALRLHGGYDSTATGGWTQHVSDNGQPYYYNAQTGESAWGQTRANS